MRIQLSDTIKEELETLSLLKGVSIDKIINNIFRVGLIVQKNIDNESNVLITQPKNNKNQVIVVPHVKS